MFHICFVHDGLFACEALNFNLEKEDQFRPCRREGRLKFVKLQILMAK